MSVPDRAPLWQRRMNQTICGEDTGKGHFRKSRLVRASRDTNVQWDQSFNTDTIPGFSVHRDPYLLQSHLQGVQLYKHRFKRPKATLLGNAAMNRWNREHLRGHARMAVEQHKQAHPWPEVEPDASHYGGRGWGGHTIGVLNTHKMDAPHGVPT